MTSWWSPPPISIPPPSSAAEATVLFSVPTSRTAFSSPPPRLSEPDNHCQNHHLSPFNEIEILSTVRSPRLVNLLGSTPNHHIAVVEFMPNGSLHDHLHGKSLPPSYPCRIRYALQIAEAVSALHHILPPLIHRDIKPSNVLIDGKGKARLGDFGLAVRIHKYRSPPPAGTMGYLDPGYVKADDVSTKTDVFSFGVLLLELITGRRPIDADYTPHSMVDWATKVSDAGEFDELWDTRVASLEGEVRSVIIGVVELACRCIGSTAEERPEMVEVVTKLKAAERRLLSASRLGRLLNRMIRQYTLSSSLVVHSLSWFLFSDEKGGFLSQPSNSSKIQRPFTSKIIIEK